MAGHVIADVIFEKLTHQAVDCATRGGEALKNIGARGILFQGALDRFQLSDNFFRAVQEIEFFAGEVRHFEFTTLVGYSIYSYLERPRDLWKTRRTLNGLCSYHLLLRRQA
jgi:hypothetical protein